MSSPNISILHQRSGHNYLYFPYACMLSCFSLVQLFVTQYTVACQVSLSIRSSRQEYWSRLPCIPPGNLPGPGIKPMSPALAGRFFITSTTWEAPTVLVNQSCPTLWDLLDSTDCSQTGSSVHGILQVRILGLVVFPSPGDLPHLGIKPRSPASNPSCLAEGPGTKSCTVLCPKAPLPGIRDHFRESPR